TATCNRFAAKLEHLSLGVAAELIEDIEVESQQESGHRELHLRVTLDGIEFTWRRSYDRGHVLQCRELCPCGGYRYSHEIVYRTDIGAWLASDGTYGVPHRCVSPEPDETEEAAPAEVPAPAAPAPSLDERLAEIIREVVRDEIDWNAAWNAEG